MTQNSCSFVLDYKLLTNLQTEKAIQPQSEKQFVGILNECPLPRGFWRNSATAAIPMDKFDASTIKPIVFTGIFTGSLGTHIKGNDLPPLFDGMHQSRTHALSFS